jgi:hypothetical protein
VHRQAEAVDTAQGKGLPWPFTLPAGWDSTPLSSGRERVSGRAAARNLDRAWGTDILATKITRPNTTRLFLLTFGQRLRLHATTSHSLAQLRDPVSAVTATVDTAVLQRRWEEFQYRVEISRVTRGAKTEHLQAKLEVYQLVSLL